MALAAPLEYRQRHTAGRSMNDASGPYVAIPKALLRQHELSFGAMVLYGILQDYTGTNEDCWPHEKTLADDMGISDRQVQRLLAELVTAGLLTVTAQPGRSRPNRYTVLPPSPTKSTTDMSTFNPESTTDMSPLRAVKHDGYVHLTTTDMSCPLKDERTPSELPQSTPHGVDAARAQSAPLVGDRSTDKGAEEAAALCRVLGITPAGTPLKSMMALVEHWGPKVSRPLEHLALECADYMDQKKIKLRTVARFSHWCDISVNGFKNGKDSAGNGAHRIISESDVSRATTAAQRRDALYEERKRRHIEQYGSLRGWD